MADQAAVADATTSFAAERPAANLRGESKSIFIVFLELFFSRWMLICGIFFSATFWSYITLERAPNTYETTAQILIRRGRVQAVQDIPILRQQEEVGSEVDILLSMPVLDETVKQLLLRTKTAAITDSRDTPPIFAGSSSARPYNSLQISDLPLTDPAALRKFLKSQIQIRKFGESNVLEVSMISVNPVFATETVNTLIDVYEKYNMQVNRTTGQTAYYQTELDRLDAEIDGYQSQLASYKQQHGVANLEKERELLTLRRHGVEIELDKLQMEKAGLESDLRSIDSPNAREQAAFLRSDQAMFKLREHIFSQQSEIAQLRSKSTEDNPLVKQKEEELQQLKINLKAEEDMAIAQQRHLFRQVQDKERELLDKIQQLDGLLLAFPTMEAQIDRWDRDIKQLTLKRIDVVEKMVRAGNLENSDETMSKVKILGYAQVPAIARDARKGFKFLVAVVLSMIASFVVAIFIEGLDHSIRRREEIEEQLNVPYLASLSQHLR